MISCPEEMQGLQITINTTEDCNMRCSYCYEINKRKHSIPFEYAKKFIDIICEDPDPIGILENPTDNFNENTYLQGLVLDFIGGDALMDVSLLDKICTYFLNKVYTTDNAHCKRWRSSFRFSISSNGTLFSKPDVKAFCEKWAKKGLLSVGVSIDGCPAIHDKNRIMAEKNPDGTWGSMNIIKENWNWYRETFKNDSLLTKATMSKDSIPYMYESLVYMHEDLGLPFINQNFIMEDAHLTEDDYKLFDEQMKKCVKYVLDHCDEMYWSMIDTNFSDHELSKGDDWYKRGHCGSGAMPCLGINGNIYPCFRWCPHTQSKDNPEPIVVGSVFKGLYNKKGFEQVREGAYKDNCTKEEKCRTCEYESACSYCIGGCFAEHQDFIRTTYICEITKLQCKWAKVYWNEYNKKKGLPMEYSEEFQLDKVVKYGQ